MGLEGEDEHCPMENQIVLCVDDDPGIRELYHEMLSRNGYEAITVGDGSQALKVFQFRRDVDLAIVDLEMPGMDGNELAERLKMLNPLLPIMMVSGSNPSVEELSPYVDAAVMKGVPLRNILDRIGLLLAERDGSLAETRYGANVGSAN